MEKVIVTPIDQAQLESWAQKLNANNVPYEVKQDQGRTVLVLDKQQAIIWLGYQPPVKKGGIKTWHIAAGLGVIIFIFALLPSKSEQKRAAATQKTVESPEDKAREDSIRTAEQHSELLQSLTGELDYIKTRKAPDFENMNAAGLQIHLASYKTWGAFIAQAEASPFDDVQKLGDKLEKQVQAIQQKEFPRLRKVYQREADKTLWEHDIDVKIGGTNNSRLEFIGGTFAANANIKTMQETVNEIVTSLRFKQIRYRWYDGADEYTYYDLDVPADGVVVK